MDAKLLEFHEAANIFPMDDENLDALSKDIKANGQQIPIELIGDKILDGRRRYMACRIGGIEPKFRKVSPDDPVAYVLSLNLHRRHLNPSQAAMCAARAKGIYEKAAKERQIEGGKNKVPANLPEASKGDSRDQAAKAFGVGGRSVDYAAKVQANAIPEIVKAVDEGRMAVSTAAILSTEPPEVQAREAANPKRNRKYETRPGGGKAEGDETPTPANEKQIGHSGPHNLTQLYAMNAAKVAVTQLKGIPEKNIHRRIAFEHVISWINSQEEMQ